LIELLVVTVVVVSLMAVVFRLSGIAGNTSNRETTVHRLQCLENCLSGYYAAFGSYPPVPLQGASRNIYRKVDENHPTVQTDDDDMETGLVWNSVRAACLSQPVAALFPPPYGYEKRYATFKRGIQAAYNADIYDGASKTHVESLLSMNWLSLESPGFLNPYQPETDCRRLQLFRYGLMAFLLPRYRFMLECAKSGSSDGAEKNGAFKDSIDNYRQWTSFNRLPPRMDSGVAYESWSDFCDIIGTDDDWQIDLIPSQAACARWLPNLRDIVSGPEFDFFGIHIGSVNDGIPKVEHAGSFMLYGAGGSNKTGGSGYPLNSLTVKDGWGNDFYYYSPAPHQTYVLWSAGGDGKTFPPWVDMEQFKSKNSGHYSTALGWMADDIKFMSTGK
jgi:type II secretory pathway pseudopilin PulG